MRPKAITPSEAAQHDEADESGHGGELYSAFNTSSVDEHGRDHTASVPGSVGAAA